MTPQFLSRFDSVIMLGDLSAASLVKIFKDIEGAIWPIAVDYFRHTGITLTITDEATALIAEMAAKKYRLGARALREVFGTIIKTLEFDPLASELVREAGREAGDSRLPKQWWSREVSACAPWPRA